MIPAFDDNGYLPPGLHPATLKEIDARFAQQSEIRQVQMESLRWLFELAKRMGVRRLVVNGSFVTDLMEPNDVDCVLLIEPGSCQDADAEDELRAGLPFLQLQIVDHEEFTWLTRSFFATDGELIPKGMIEVEL